MGEYIYLIAPVCGWVVAQSIKFALTLHKDGISIADAVQSGGMPSSHAAFMMALATVIGLEYGIDSIFFGIAIAVTGVIIYDSLGVRRTTGQQTQAINQLAKAQKIKLTTPINDARGHTLPEVAVGVLVGVIVGSVLFTIT